jgi:hypothetical protein
VPRPRKKDPSIPAHIDQDAIPKGVYWDRSGKGRWYVRSLTPEGKIECKTVAGATAKLSDLHAIAEDGRQPDAGTLDHLMGLFAESVVFKSKSDNTRRDYGYCRKRISGQMTRQRTTFGTLMVARLTAPVIQRLIDLIAEQHPTMAAHCLRYLRRLFRWGRNRGHCAHNPAEGVESPELNPSRVMPTPTAHAALLQFARERGARKPRTEGSVAPYLWICMELCYLCHLRGIELIDFRESQAEQDWLLTERRKGSRSTRFRWTPRLRAAWDAAIKLRNDTWAKKRKPTPLRKEDRPVIVSESGGSLRKSSMDTAWQRLIELALKEKIIAAEDRFALHGLKRRGMTDRPGTRDQKQDASGHRSAQMVDIYDQSVPLVDPATGG